MQAHLSQRWWSWVSVVYYLNYNDILDDKNSIVIVKNRVNVRLVMNKFKVTNEQI